MTCLQLPERSQQTQDSNLVVRLGSQRPSHNTTLPPSSRGKAWCLSSLGHPIFLFSSVPRALRFGGPRSTTALALGLRPSPPITACMQLFMHLEPLGATHAFTSPVYVSLIPSTSPWQGWGNPHPCPIHFLGKSSTPVLHKGSRREPSLPVWLGHQLLVLTSHTKPVMQPKPPGVGAGWGQAGKQERAERLLDT